MNDKRLLKVDAEKIKDLLNSKIHTELISDGAASSKKGLPLTNSDIISEGVASLIDKIYQQQNNVKLYQSAYHGTPHKFDKFSLDAIGSGEGAQAHGWGLYFAADKNVSGDYRIKLSGDKVYYNSQELDKVYTFQWKMLNKNL